MTVLNEDLAIRTSALVGAWQIETAMRARRYVPSALVNVRAGSVMLGEFVARMTVTDVRAFLVFAASTEADVFALRALVNIDTRCAVVRRHSETTFALELLRTNKSVVVEGESRWTVANGLER